MMENGWMRLGLVGLMTCFGGRAEGALVSVSNGSFEADGLGPGSFIFSASGWQQGGGTNSGTVRSGGGVFPGVPDGDQVAFVNGGGGPGGTGGLFQVLGVVIQPDTLYTLRVRVGDRSDFGFPMTVVALGAGGTWGDQLLPVHTASTPEPDAAYALWTVQYRSDGFPGLVGQALRVELNADGLQALFDDVQVDAVVIPEPSRSLLGAVALVWTSASRRRQGSFRR